MCFSVSFSPNHTFFLAESTRWSNLFSRHYILQIFALAHMQLAATGLVFVNGCMGAIVRKQHSNKQCVALIDFHADVQPNCRHTPGLNVTVRKSHGFSCKYLLARPGIQVVLRAENKPYETLPNLSLPLDLLV